MNSSVLITSASVLQRNYVLLRAGTLQLILPQTDILATEYLSQRPVVGPVEGLFDSVLNGVLQRTVAISEQMLLLKKFPRDRFVVTVLPGANGGSAWAWNEMKVLTDQTLCIQPLPAICLAPYSPVEAYIEYGDGLAFVCSGESLTRFVMSQRS